MDKATGNRGRGLVRAALAGVVAVMLLAPVVPVSASEAPEGSLDESRGPVRAEPPWIRRDKPEGFGMGLWFWPEGGRFFQLTGSSTSDLSKLQAYDAETLAEAGHAVLEPQAWSVPDEWHSGAGRHHTAAVDRDNGRIFVAYRTALAVTEGVGVGREGEAVTDGESPCSSPATALALYPAPCVGGIHVLDAGSLEPVGGGKVRLALPTVEGQRAIPIVRALEYVPAVPELGWGGRVVMIVEEIAPGPLEAGIHSAAGLTATNNVTPRRNSGNVAYAVAFDPDGMRQEWAVRLEGCRNARPPRGWVKELEGHPATVFRVGGEAPGLYVGCHGNAAQQGVVVRVPLDSDGIPASLPVTVGRPDPMVEPGEPDAVGEGVAGLVAPAARQEVFPGPDKVTVMLADPVSRRILMRVDDSGEVWWVFDGLSNQFLGTVGIGGYGHGHTTFGLDPDVGRLYVLAAKAEEGGGSAQGGLYIADIRRNPLAQALQYPHLADPARSAIGLMDATSLTPGRAMSVQPRGGGDRARIFSTIAQGHGAEFRVIVDESPVSVDAADDEAVVRTLDIDEAEGVTQATFDGTARGFGFRTILIGGAEGASRVGPADPVGWARGVPQFQYHGNFASQGGNINSVGAPVRQVLPPDPCSDAQRELIVAFVGPRGPAVVDASSARGEAQPVLVDVRTKDDVAAPVTRCLPEDWQSLWETALVSQPPMAEPGVAWPFDDATSSCTATDEEQSESWSDPVLGVFSSKVSCSQDEAGGWGQARGVNVDGVSVADTLASFRIYLDDERGMVARVESVARGVNIGGVVKIDTIRGSAESWANGHAAPDADAPVDATVFNPFNCDTSRPAGTCFQRHIFGVSAVAPNGSRYGCGPCGDEDALIEGLNRALGSNASARFREPDRELARGSADGYVAAITKKSKERFADIVMNADLLETMVPMLEVVRYAPHNRPSANGGAVQYSTGTPPRGRQVFQFAAVEVSSTYGIQCLLVFDEATNTCAEAAEVPGSIQVSLSDGEGAPLAGGAFEVRADVDADGVLGLKDTLLPDGACVTAEDGIGTCTFEGLQPGTYLVNQVAAPPGYAKSAEPWVSEVASGEQRTVAFTNVSNVSTIDMTVTDEDGAPLSGASFAAYPDPDADGKVAPDAEPAATCTTDAQGVCSMQVPAGSYVLVQTGAPGGLEGIEPVAFTFASGGQVAAVTVVNYPPSQPAGPEGAASPEIAYTAPVGYSPPVESIADTYVPADNVGAPAIAGPSVPEQIGGTVVRVIRAPGDALRLFARDPQQAVAFTAALALLVLALLAVRRRQLLGGLTAVPAFAFTGGGTPPPAPPRPVGNAPAAFSDTPSASSPSMHAATAVLERPPFVAGAAPSMLERASARIVVATGHPVLAALATQRLVDVPSCDVVAVADSLEALRSALTEHAPDVVVVDLAMPTGSDQDVCDVLASLHPAERTVGLIPPNRAIEALITRGHAAGLGGLLATEEDLTNGQLGYAVRCVSVGKTFFGPAVQAVLLRKFPAPARPGSPAALLTSRQLEIARLAAGGIKRVDIAERLFLSPATVKRHLSEVRKRLGVTNPWDLTQLRARLDEAGLLDDPGHAAD